jgi:DNA-binding Xre family transcriptional regulator
MAVLNRVKDYLEKKGVESGYQFWQQTQLPQSTAFRIWGNPRVYPSKRVLGVICETFKCAPGDLLEYVQHHTDPKE